MVACGRYENAELLCRVTTLMAADSLRDDLFRKALEPTSKQQNDVEAAWFHSRVYEPWIEALSEVGTLALPLSSFCFV